MAEDIVSIIKVGTDEAVKNIADLRQNISTLKESLQNLDIGSEEYQSTLKELSENQTALKNAMYATDASMTDVAKAAKGMGETYNGLVKQMADYKTQLRNVDVSTETGRKRFAELAEKINDCNDKLKAMDAVQGNYQRNVGNYQTAFKGLGEKIDGFGKGLKVAKGSTESLKGAMDAASKTPMLVLLGLVVNSLTKLVGAFKESEEGTQSMQAAMVSLEPIMNVFKNIFSKLADFLGNIVVKVTEFVTKNGLLDKVIKAVMGVGNVIVQYILTPFKAVAAAIKKFQEEGIKGIGNAAKAFADEYKNGFSFKKNFEAGQAVGDALKGGMKSKKKEVESTAKEIGDSAGSTIAKSIMKGFEDALKWRAERKAIMEQWEKENPYNDDLFQIIDQDELDAMSEAYISDFLKPYVDATNAQIEADQKAIASAEARKAGMNSLVGTTASILGSLADIIETSGKESEKNARAVKALQIAQATINTISGAVGAFMGITRDTGGWGIAAAAAEAAAVTAAGVAQIAKIKNTAIGSSTSTSGASVTAPSVSTSLANVRSITTQSEEDRLNKMATNQRVYILSSDIEASQDAIKARVAEASF